MFKSPLPVVFHVAMNNMQQLICKLSTVGIYLVQFCTNCYNISVRASPVVLSMRPRIVTSEYQIFLTSMFSYLLFSNPTHKTKIVLQIGGKLLLAKHLHQPL